MEKTTDQLNQFEPKKGIDWNSDWTKNSFFCFCLGVSIGMLIMALFFMVMFPA